MADRIEYGDKDGTIAGDDGAGDQTVPRRDPSWDGLDPAFVFGDAEALAGRANGGDDTVGPGSRVRNDQFGDARTISEDASGGNDVLQAYGFFNVLHGDAPEMTGGAQGGDDSLKAGSSPGTRSGAVNTLYGDAFRMGDCAQGGDDTLTGVPDGYGYFDGATMYGDAYEMAGRSQGGDDRLVSGRWPENMWGDAAVMSAEAEGGRDVFVLTPGPFQRDTIHDFEPGKDRIDLSAFAEFGLSDFAGLTQQVVEESYGTFVVLDFPDRPEDTWMRVKGAVPLSEGDFIFG